MRRLLPPAEPTQPDEPDLVSTYAVPDGQGPHLRVNFVSTLDGVVGLDGVSAPLSSPVDRRLFSLLRALADVILVGAGTARKEGYGPARPGERSREVRAALGLSPVPPIAVVTASMALDLTTPFFTEAVARPLVLTAASAPEAARAAAAEVADVVVAGDAEVDPAAVVGALAARGLRRILCEGGPVLFGHLLAADLVDELCLTVAPLLAGGAGPRLVPPQPGFDPRRFGLASLIEADDGYLFARYDRRRV